MPSKVEICNLALMRIGEDYQIVSLTDQTAPARKCNLLYDMSLKEILSRHDWNFSKKYAQPSYLAETPLFDYTYSYAIPADSVRICTVNGERKKGWSRVGQRIYTNDSTMNLVYVSNDPALVVEGYFSTPFATALSRLIAMYMLPSRNGKDPALYDAIRKEYDEMYLPMAMKEDADTGGDANRLYDNIGSWMESGRDKY